MMENKQELLPGWKWMKLGEVCEINPPRPKNFTRSPDAQTTFVPMVAVDKNFLYITSLTCKSWIK